MSRPGRRLANVVTGALVCALACTGAARAGSADRLMAGPGGEYPYFPMYGSNDRGELDSLAREDVVRCVSVREARVKTSGEGTARGVLVRYDPTGLWLERVQKGERRERFVPWTSIRRVDAFESRPRTRSEGWTIGSAVGLVVGVVVVLQATDPPGDFGDLVYPLAVVVGALPFGLVGGLIGMSHPGTTSGWAPCWP